MSKIGKFNQICLHFHHFDLNFQIFSPKNDEGPPSKKLRLVEDKVINFADLPHETLEHLFKFLAFNDQMQLMEVCKKFFDVLQLPIFAKNVVLAFEFCLLSLPCPPCNFLVNSKRKFYNIRFGDKVTIWNCGSKFWKNIGSFIENVIFDSMETYEGLDFILWEFPRVREISLFFNDIFNFDIPKSITAVTFLGDTVNSVTMEDYQKFIQISKQMEKLMVKNVEIFDEVSDEKKLFDVQVPKGIDWAKFFDSSNQTIEVAPFDLLKKKNITSADIENLDYWNLEPLDDFVNLKKITLNMTENGCFFIHSAQKLPKLTQVHLKCNVINLLGYCTTCLKFLKKSSAKIDSLKVSGSKFPRLNILIEYMPTKPLKYLNLVIEVDYNEISFDHPELETLILKVSTPNYTFNCSNLPDSSKLKHLEIRNNSPTCVEISNLQMLIQKCPGMKKIHFERLNFEQILVIEQGWSNLVELRIEKVLDGRELVKKLAGNFKKLKVLGDPLHQVDPEDDEDFNVSQTDGDLFKKIPTLRRSNKMDFSTYCLLEYDIKLVTLKSLEYGEESEDSDE